MYVYMCTYVCIFISSPEIKAPALTMPSALWQWHCAFASLIPSLRSANTFTTSTQYVHTSKPSPVNIISLSSQIYAIIVA